MTSGPATIRIGYVPEHYLTPLHLALRSPAAQSLPFTLALIPFPSGTGHMITSLREKEIDIGIGLTEGWIAGLAGKQQAQKDTASGGYKVVGHWVDTPLRWAIVTGRNRDALEAVSDLQGKRVGVSRMGSGSHIMSFVLAQQNAWKPDSLTPVPLGPFGALTTGVTGDNGASDPTAEFFMWEHFTTKPSFHPTVEKPQVPLKKIGEIFTPWPSWMIVASTAVFPNPETDKALGQLFQVLDQGIKAFQSDLVHVVTLLGTGELGCKYGEEDAGEWLKDVRFTTDGTRGVDRKVVEDVVDILKVAGVIDPGMTNDEAVARVIGIPR
ncbi:hypothetical protein P175DRAFT_0437679 [Aspergillus ochraceoroseus IBT 24754]|uniref:Ca3427-like PBP 2 domain-containing protein n=2 Tax=Aspergillus ochraceoroseus TaxID=138278 RepID=A0A2T5LXN7_9EURO|nr:uncharacterized protein P175DRAFT_0437679 [Aspergillus ochraceoroseus IBT 24754]KKK14509.1 hypothetical protein AOCH_001600 [Aspergillus ochraceoroseus]PTU21044.1 hypothetical protein P175DRAFT_0437679 [Aspergillus ochraceoroseus IBT 24754]